MAYQRKTVSYYSIQGDNGYGWEEETIEESFKDAKAQAKCYRENVNYPIRIKNKRVSIEKWNSGDF
jgi:hypothetical protein